MCSNHKSLLTRLLEHGLLIETGVDGLYGRSAAFEDVIGGLVAYISRFAAGDDATCVSFPPGMNRALFERSGYLKGFPQLAGTVHAFMGGEAEHRQLLDDLESGADWTGGQKATDVVLTPAACYPLYPAAAKAGPVPAEGRLYSLSSYCFRHEPSPDPARMQLFRMREYVRMGTAEQVLAFRETWMQRGRAMIEGLGLPMTLDIANDPFFGRKGRILASGQREQALKFELLVPVTSNEQPTACMSFNYHQKHFADTWGLRTEDGATAHTACVGFGMERIALALFSHHGLDVAEWPDEVLQALWS